MTPSKPVVTVLEGARPVRGLEPIEARAEVRVTDAAGLASALAGADVLYLWDFFSEDLRAAWPAADRLRWIHVPAAGVDKLLFPELRDSDVLVTNAHGVFDRPMAEYVLAGILWSAKELGRTQDLQRGHEWHRRTTRDVAGASALVIGTGGIGRCTARTLRAMGMDVAGGGRTARSGDPDFGEVHDTARLAEVVGRFDYVVLVAPLTPATENLLSREVLESVRPGAFLVNVGRGRTVDEAALVDVLRSGRLSGALLDTFVDEPLPAPSPLWDMPQVLVSPHMSSDTDGWLDRLAAQFAENFVAWQEGRPMANVVDKRLGYVPGTRA